ncbi:MAG: DEAD/DEAH box helicase, partial [Nitrososphaerales archaeon]
MGRSTRRSPANIENSDFFKLSPLSSSFPEHIKTLLSSLGYSSLFPPQTEAIEKGALERKNLLVSTPTASGKTLIALMAALDMILKNGKKVVYLSPLRALAYEKKEEFDCLTEFVKSDGTRIRVLISTGDYDVGGNSLRGADIIILTNEKFDSILRHGVSWLEEVGLFVVDEIHLVGDSHRGPSLEGVLANILTQAEDAQVIALSATITNDDELAKWL